MRTEQIETLPSPPSLWASLLAGFDAVTTHLPLILFPILLDLFIWLGPHVKVERLIEAFSNQMLALSAAGNAAPDANQILQANQEIWGLLGQRMNLFAALRAYPVGIPSLMASRLPLQAPAGLAPVTVDISSLLVVIPIALGLLFVGLVIGSLYYEAVANAVSAESLKWNGLILKWPRAAAQTFILAIIWVAAIIVISIPASCVISVLALGSPTLGQLGMLAYGMGIIWLLFPLLLSPYGIFIYRDNAINSLRKGIRITRMTLPTTGLLFLSVLVINQVMNYLWASPVETSWFVVVGIIGHAFVATGLLSATFVYYHKADQWIQAMLAYWSQASAVKE